MIHQDSLSSNGTHPFSDKPFTNTTGVELPGITLESQQAVTELLEKNRQNFHIFFNDKNFFNHCAHHLLAAYSFGASPEQLKKIYERHVILQKPKPPSKVTITRENWKEHLGNRDLWTDYLNFFDQVIKEDGMEKVLNEYAFYPQMISRLFFGAFHPIIHVGYGLEFQLPSILAEGLAAAALYQDRLQKLIDSDYLNYKGGDKKKKIIDIVNEVQQDERFDIITHEVNGKLIKLLSERVDVVKDIAKQWSIPETVEGVKEATHELYEAIVLVYGSTGIRPDKTKIECDFFLMHGVTSMLLLFSILPYVSLEKRILLLKSQFIAVLCQYIAEGRPKFHVDNLIQYQSKKLDDGPNPWFDIIKNTLLEDSDSHVIKTIRSLLKAQQEWAPADKNNIFVKAAQLTYDGYELYGWGREIGFEEEWE